MYTPLSITELFTYVECCRITVSPHFFPDRKLFFFDIPWYMKEEIVRALSRPLFGFSRPENESDAYLKANE